MLVDNLLKLVQTECLVAFAHSRITGLAGKGEEGVEVFSNRFVQKEITNRGKVLAEAIKDLATIDYINSKISSNGHIALSNMYHHHYNKIATLLEMQLSKNPNQIEGLIGLHLLVMATEKGLLDYGSGDNLNFYKKTIALYENDKFSTDSEVKETVKRMFEISKNIFNKYFEKQKRTSTRVNKKRTKRKN
jgi:hypothetical protein